MCVLRRDSEHERSVNAATGDEINESENHALYNFTRFAITAIYK